jgi:adenylate cyclase
VIAKRLFDMTDDLIEGQDIYLPNQEKSDDSPLSLSSATLRYHSANENHDFAINRLSICTIGRNAANSISIDDNLMSRDHATLRCSADGVCELSDMGSSNGTRVNGSLIDGAVTLKNGDVIQVGQHIINFLQSPHSTGVISNPDEDDSVAVFPPNSLITALSINVRGYPQLLQILGEEILAKLMADIAEIAGDIFTRRKIWSYRHDGSAIHAVWAHCDDYLPSHELLNVFDAIAEIQLELSPLQKRYHLLRPIGFGCGVTTGHALLENVGEVVETDFGALCSVIQQAYHLEMATHSTGCDILIAESGFALLSPPLSTDRLPAPCSIHTKNMPQMMNAYALQFNQLAMLSGAMSEIAIKAAGHSAR